MGGRGRGKGRKSNDINNEDHGSDEEEKTQVQKRRGRPQKPLKDDIDDEVAKTIMEDEDAITGISIKDTDKKRKKKENAELLEEEDLNEEKSGIEDSSKTNVHANSNRSRRKGKPCRAAEAWVECS